MAVLVLKCAFVVGGEVAATTTTRALTGRGGDLDQISVATDQEAGPAEMRCQPEGAAGRWVNMPLTSEGLSAKNGPCLLARAEEVRSAMA